MNKNKDLFIERRIVIGLIISDHYLREIHRIYAPEYIESSSARTIIGWVLSYFDKYNKAPKADIEAIYIAKSKKMKQDKAEDIASILESLSDELDRNKLNVEYLLDQTRAYFLEKKLLRFSDTVHGMVEDGDLTQAEEIAATYAALPNQINEDIEPFNMSFKQVSDLFSAKDKPIISFPGAFGKFINPQLTRNALVSFMAPEKRGKTFLLLECAIRAVRTGSNVVFFQAGDMSESQQLKRLMIYLSQKSDKPQYCKEQYIPVIDCEMNQNGVCNRPERESKTPLFKKGTSGKNIRFEDLLVLHQKHKNYKPCRNCKKIKPCIWLRKEKATEPLNAKEAFEKLEKFKSRTKKRLKIATYPNDTLSVQEIESKLMTWEKQQGFVPDVIIIDYADLLTTSSNNNKLEARHQVNKIWKDLRALSQKKHALVLTATQASAKSYGKGKVGLKDFSESKTKYAHVTAMYGLNQNEDEKKIGILRVGEIVLRDGEFNPMNECVILQRLQKGRPFLGSYRK